jgi:hypothetical protein
MKHDLPPESCAMSEHPFVKIRGMLAGWRSEQIQPPPPADEDFRHSTSPEARMNLLLRFETESGPRTIVAAGIALRAASEIAHAMKCAGHFAEITDHLPPVTMAERMKRRRAEDAFTNAYGSREMEIRHTPTNAQSGYREIVVRGDNRSMPGKANDGGGCRSGEAYRVQGAMGPEPLLGPGAALARLG